MRIDNEPTGIYSQLAITGAIGLFNNLLSYIFLFICSITLLEGDYGILVIILSSISTFSSIIDLGIRGSVSRAIAAKSNLNDVYQLISIGFFLEVFLFCLTSPFVYTFLLLIVPYSFSILILIFLNHLQLYLIKVFFGLRKDEKANYILLIFNLMKILIALLLSLLVNPEIGFLISLLFIDYIFVILIGIFFLRNLIKIILPKRAYLKEIFEINFVIWQGSVNFQLFSAMPVILLGFFISSKIILTEFSYAFTLSSIGWIMIGMMSSVFIPFLVVEKESEQRFSVLLLLVCSLELFYIVIIQLGSRTLYVFTKLSLFGSFQSLNLILFGLVPFSLLSIRKFMLIAQKKVRILHLLNIVETFLLILLPLVLVQFFGVNGANIAYFATSILSLFLIAVCYPKEIRTDILMIIFSTVFCLCFIVIPFFAYISWIIFFPSCAMIWKLKGFNILESIKNPIKVYNK